MKKSVGRKPTGFFISPKIDEKFNPIILNAIFAADFQLFMKLYLSILVFSTSLLVSFSPLQNVSGGGEKEYIRFRFKGQEMNLNERIRTLPEECWGGWCQSNEQLDTLCNIYLTDKKRVKIIRQDDGFEPITGIGLLFQFDPAVDSLPFLSPSAKLQLVDFTFGGARGTRSDDSNFTGVTNDVSSDSSARRPSAASCGRPKTVIRSASS